MAVRPHLAECSEHKVQAHNRKVTKCKMLVNRVSLCKGFVASWDRRCKIVRNAALRLQTKGSYFGSG